MVAALELKVILLDEPTAGLIKTEGMTIGSIRRQLTGELDNAAIIVEHDVDFVREISRRIVVLYQGARGKCSSTSSRSPSTASWILQKLRPRAGQRQRTLSQPAFHHRPDGPHRRPSAVFAFNVDCAWPARSPGGG